MPHNISNYSSTDGNNEFTDLSIKSSTEPTAQPRSNVSCSAGSGKLTKVIPNVNAKHSNRKPLLVTQESWHDFLDKNDPPNFDYSDGKSRNVGLLRLCRVLGSGDNIG